MQLVAYGAQDIYLTGNPQITFFKVVYRRHTNFSMEAIPQVFDGTADVGKTVVCTVPRNGDLVHRMYVKVKTDAALTQYTDLRPLLKSIELEIGGQKIDKQYWFWQQAWQELTYNQAQVNALYSMAMSMNAAAATGDYFYLPLDFYFCRNPGLALPLIALQYHEVKVRVEFNTAAEIRLTTTGVAPGTNLTALSSAELVCDYIYLDTDERRRFAQVSHEYLIEQVQFTGAEVLTTSTNRINLHFNHPVKELVWVYNGSCSSASTNPAYISEAKLQLNGHDRMKAESGDYFLRVQRFQHHTGVGFEDPADSTPSGDHTIRARLSGKLADWTRTGIYCYSFGLRPEEHQPSGTCNFSRIDNAVLSLTTTAGNSGQECHIFAHSYNVLRVMSGMGGLAYSN